MISQNLSEIILTRRIPRTEKLIYIEMNEDDSYDIIKEKIAVEISNFAGRNILADGFNLVTYGEFLNDSNIEKFKIDKKAQLVPLSFMDFEFFGPERTKGRDVIKIQVMDISGRKKFFMNLRKGDVDEIYNQISKKISKIIGKNINEDDFEIIVSGKLLKESNFEKFLKNKLIRIKPLTFDSNKLFEGAKYKIFKINTEYIYITDENSNITKQDIENFLEGRKDLIIGDLMSRTKLSIDENFVNVEVNMRYSEGRGRKSSAKQKIFFTVKLEDIEDQLYKYINKYQLV